MEIHRRNLTKDFLFIALSVLFAVLIVKTGALQFIFESTQEMKFIGSFVAGMFFTSAFSTAPAVVALGQIAQSGSVFWTAVLGAVGALIGDFLLFRFVEDRLAEDFGELIKEAKAERFVHIFHLRLFRRLVPFVGALIIASPLPDELGIAMMGLSKMKTSLFVPVSFLMNFLGILLIGLVAKAFS